MLEQWNLLTSSFSITTKVNFILDQDEVEKNQQKDKTNNTIIFYKYFTSGNIWSHIYEFNKSIEALILGNARA